MLKRSKLLVVLLFILELSLKPGQAQQNAFSFSSDTIRIDSLYISDHTDQLTVSIFSVYQDAVLMNSYGNLDRIDYRPNVNLRFGITAYYKWLGLGISLGNFFNLRNPNIYGNTSSVDLRLNAFSRTMAAEVYYQNYKGFYISHPAKPDGSYYVMPGLSTFSIGLAGYWIYNHHRYSIRAAYIQTERQKKSAGSVMLRPFFVYSKINSDNGLIPEEIRIKYQIPLSKIITDVEFYSIGISPGYSYTWVFLNNFFISGTIFPGVAFQFYNIRDMKKSWSDFEFSFKMGLRVTAGYNSDKWFIGGAFQTSFNQIPEQISNTNFDYDLASIKVWAGTRFNIFTRKKNLTFANQR